MPALAAGIWCCGVDKRPSISALPIRSPLKYAPAHNDLAVRDKASPPSGSVGRRGRTPRWPARRRCATGGRSGHRPPRSPALAGIIGARRRGPPDDLSVVDALQVDPRDPDVCVTEVAPDDVQRNALDGYNDRAQPFVWTKTANTSSPKLPAISKPLQERCTSAAMTRTEREEQLRDRPRHRRFERHPHTAWATGSPACQKRMASNVPPSARYAERPAAESTIVDIHAGISRTWSRLPSVGRL
jgi:hypothetical protein